MALEGRNITESDSWNRSYFINYTVLSDDSFFMTYFSKHRFRTECILSSLSALFNLLALVLVLRARDGHIHRPIRRSVYNILFVNLAIANILTCILSVVCNNLLFLFEEHFNNMIYHDSSDSPRPIAFCVIMVNLLAGVFVSTAFGIESFLTMLGFATIQFFAICYPLRNLTLSGRKTVCFFVLFTWLFSLTIPFTPFLAALLIPKDSIHCLERIYQVVLIGVDSCVTLVAVMYVTIIVLCIRIYYEVRKMGHRLSEFRCRHEMMYEKKAFSTTLILLSTLTVFYLPYSIIYMVSLNTSTGAQNVINETVIYYMTLLPYLKCLTDPFIYGLRMKELHQQWREMAGCCLRLQTQSFHERIRMNTLNTSTKAEVF